MNNIKYLFHGVAILSLIIIIVVGFVLDETPESWKHGYEMGIVLFSLSTSFFAAYFFYIMDIFFPYLKKRKQLTIRLIVPLNRVLNFMNYSISCIAKITNLKYSEITKDKLDEKLAGNWNMELKESPMLSPDLKTSFSYLDYFVYNIREIEGYVSRINLLPEVDFELLLLMDKLVTSKFHENIRLLKDLKRTYPQLKIDNSNLTDSFEEYIEILFEIQSYMIKNKINFTVDTKDFN
ncbi:MAG: hypothetical protein ABS882_07065 [Lysinibacillus sp.]